MIRLLTAGVLSSCALSICALAQSGNTKLRFEVASIRPISRDELTTKFGQGAYSGLTLSGRRVTGGFQMSTLMSTAFRLNPRLIMGVPLVSNDLFVIEALMPDDATKDQLPEMLRALLEDRFHLKTHLEAMDQSGYALVSGKGTLQLNKPREIDMATVAPGRTIRVFRAARSAVREAPTRWFPPTPIPSGGRQRP